MTPAAIGAVSGARRTMTSPHQRAAQMLAAAADLLDQGQSVNRLSIALTAIGLGVLLIPMLPASDATQPTAAIVAILGVIELFFAARVAIERGAVPPACGRRRLGTPRHRRLRRRARRAEVQSVEAGGKPIGRRLDFARRYLVAQILRFRASGRRRDRWKHVGLLQRVLTGAPGRARRLDRGRDSARAARSSAPSPSCSAADRRRRRTRFGSL